MSQLWHEKETIESLNLAVAVVTFQAGPVVNAYVKETGLQWPILIDDQLSLYKSYGMERGSHWNVLGPSSVWKYMKLMAQGQMPKMAEGDVWQLGGDVLIDPSGRVRLHHVGIGPADRPSVESILSSVQTSSAT